jgi:serine/threonine protein kinase
MTTKFCPQCKLTYPEKLRFCLEDGKLLSLKDPYHLVGQTLLDKYRLDALVGMGGFGAVYSAHHLGLDRRVAFKILQPNLMLRNKSVVDLFEREARLAARLHQENIVWVMDAGRTPDDIAYIAMEWLDGRTLEEELEATGPLSLERTGQILRQIAAALDTAHANYTIHRDLKPSNVMLIKSSGGPELVKVLDFGIAKVLNSTTGAPVSHVMGTPHYASPEQFVPGGHIDQRSDIYSLGVMLYQMLTGILPFNASSMEELIQLKLEGQPKSLRTLRPDAPAAVEQLVSRMLVKDPDQRPGRMSEVVALFDSSEHEEFDHLIEVSPRLAIIESYQLVRTSVKRTAVKHGVIKAELIGTRNAARVLKEKGLLSQEIYSRLNDLSFVHKRVSHSNLPEVSPEEAREYCRQAAHLSTILDSL